MGLENFTELVLKNKMEQLIKQLKVEGYDHEKIENLIINNLKEILKNTKEV